MRIKHKGTLGYLHSYDVHCQFDSLMFSRLIVVCGVTHPTEQLRHEEAKRRFLSELRHYARRRYGEVELVITDNADRITYKRS